MQTKVTPLEGVQAFLRSFLRVSEGTARRIKGYIRQCWCRYMIEETEKGDSPIRRPPKESLVDWILNAQEKIESKKEIIQKSFIVAGITCNQNDLARDNTLFSRLKKSCWRFLGKTTWVTLSPKKILKTHLPVIHRILIFLM